MGSCTSKQTSSSKSKKPLTTFSSKIATSPKESFENPHIRAKIFIAKDLKAPALNLKANKLWASRMQNYSENQDNNIQ